MPVSVRLDTLAISCNFGEPVLPPASDYWHDSKTHYPYQRFLESKEVIQRTIRILVVENSYVEYSFFPEFGCRLVGIRDKRTGKWALDLPHEIILVKGDWDHGVSFGTLELSSFAPDSTDFEVEHDNDSEDVASVVFYETLPILQVSCQVRISLNSDSPWLDVDCSMVNRAMSCCQVETGIGISSSGQTSAVYGKDWLCVSQRGDDSWLSIRFFEGDFTETRRSDRSTELVRLNSSHVLAGAMNDNWSLSLCLLTGIANVDFLTEEFGIGVAESKLTIVSQFGKPKCQIQLTSVKGESFQSAADLYSEQPFQASLLGIGELASISISHGEEHFQHSFENQRAMCLKEGQLCKLGIEEVAFWTGSKAIQEAIELINLGQDPSVCARAALIHAGDRAIANTILSIHTCRDSDWDASLAHLDQALAHEASNGLLWWMRAVINRQRAQSDDQPDRLNAHFLLPMEPALRAEAFLSQAAVTSMDPIPLIASVALHQWAAAEIAALYWNLGLFRDVVRWVDECCRHRESSWLRIVYAAAYLKLKGKEMETHTQLQFAKRVGIGAPFPTTEMEFRILDELRKRFPGIEILEQWNELVQRVR